MNHVSVTAINRYRRMKGHARRRLFVWLLLALTLNLTLRPAAAGCGAGGFLATGASILSGVPGLSLLTGAGAAAGCAADQAKEVIEIAGRETRETVVVAGDQGVRVARVAGEEAEQLAATIGNETREVIMVGSNETQEIIGVAGDTANDVLHTAGMEGQALIDALGSEAERLTVIASHEAQAVAHVAGAEARATAAAMGAEFQEVVMLISDESMALTRLAGEEARQVVRVAGEEARLTLDRFQANNERLLQQISETYQGNLDITIDSLDEGSQKVLLNYYDTLVAVNEVLTDDVLLIEASSRRVIAGAGDEADAVVNHLETSMANLIIVAGEATVYVVDRTTNNVITVMAIILTGLGLLLLIYLFFVHQMPVGKSARIVYAFMTVYLFSFGLLVLSPTARVYAMRSAQVGLRAELEQSTEPQVILYRVVTEGTDDNGARVEIDGRHLLAGATPPVATLDGQPLVVGIASDESLTFPLDAATTARLREREMKLVIDFGRPELLAVLNPYIANPFDTVEPYDPERERVALSALVGVEARVYAGPSETQYADLGTLEAGARYVVTDRDSERTWWAILWNGGQGWVADRQVSLIGNPTFVGVGESTAPTVTPIATSTSTATSTPSATPTLSPTATPSPTPCVWTVTATLNANIRSGPDKISYDVIGTLRQGQTAAIIGRSADDAWSVIDYNGRQGWISDDVVSINNCPAERPPYVPAPPTPVPSPTPVVPYRSCAEIRQARPDAADGYYTLYVGGDVGKPFDVFCLGMGQNPAEYLPLPNSGEGGSSNYTMFNVGGATRGTDQYEYFHLIRLDPFTLEIDRSDRAFSTLVGRYEYKPEYEDTHDWRRMNYGEVRSCVAPRDTSSHANVDLSGTPFTLAPSVVAVPGGHLPGWTADFSSDRKVVNLRGGGFCGGLRLEPLVLTYVGQ